MYASYWGLSASPFSGREETRWFHETPVHEEALARLAWLIEQQRGFGLLAGEAGSGKTLTLRVLAGQIQRSQRQVAWINLLGADPHEMLWNLASALHAGPAENASRWALWRQVIEQFEGFRLSRVHTVLVFDHLERADAACHVLLERLCSVAGAASPLVTFLAAVRSDSLGRLSPLLSDLSDLRVELFPLQVDETDDLVTGLLERAGATRRIFTSDAVVHLQWHSQGQPRLICRLCELSLIAGMAAGLDHIDAGLVDTVAGGLVTARPSQTADQPALV